MIRIAALALTLASGAQQKLPSDSAVRAFLVPRVAAFPDSGRHGAGIVVGLLDATGAPRIIAVGVDSTRLFEIGSITKVFTTSILEAMVERGELRLEDPVAKFLPRSVRIPARNGRQITLLELATQSSGLPRLPSNLTPRDSLNPYADYTVQQLYAFLSGYELTRDIGAEYEYSNLGMGLLGHALALKAGTSYEALVRRRILGPLGMGETAITLTPALRARIAPGHDNEGHVVPNWDLPTLAGAGALRSTAADMLKFLAANIDSTATPLSRTFRHTQGERHATNNANMKIGLAWHLFSRPVGTIVWHNGGTGGYRSYLGFDPVRRLGVVVLSNIDASVDDIGIHLLDETVPLRRPPPRRTQVAVDSSVLNRYVGEYELAPTFHVVVTREAANLFVQATGQPRFPVFGESDSTFFLKVVDAQISFERDTTGTVRGLVLHQNGQVIPGKKIR
jgi:D-alanyl-D-alanine-carboxypeptidase/D-alanyl-D-alanine-endopeptidase